MIALLAACVPLAAWLYLLIGRGGFWLARERDDRAPSPDPAAWPPVVAVVPARDEADVVARSIGSLLAQDYPGPFRVVLVDDGSSDGTAGIARAAAVSLGREDRLTVLTGAPLPPGWTGKLWAMAQGVEHAGATPEHLLLTDADIAHSPDNLRRLVARSEAGGLVMSSLMVRLHCRGLEEEMLIPAFVFFFQMLYPFPLVNDPRSRTAGAAGGCMLVRRDALEQAGGVAAIRSALIDDCTLGALMKRQGPIRLELGSRAWSLRPYEDMEEIGRMVSRSAYAQLNYSPWLLAGTVAGMLLLYVMPIGFALFGSGWARPAGGLTWALMALAYAPTLRWYRASALWAFALPWIGLFYTRFTIQSAIDTWRGKGGVWKGRSQARLHVPSEPVQRATS